MKFQFYPILALLIVLSFGCTRAQTGDPSFAEADAVLTSWSGNSGPVNSPAQSLDGRLVVGYQGWYGAEGDGSGVGWRHYGVGNKSHDQPRTDRVTIDYWPDMSEAGPSEKFPTEFRHADGSTAMVFSSAHPDTVDRHFLWMKQYGIDSAFLQRFGGSLKRPTTRNHRNIVLRNVRDSANRHGRAYAVMYDLSGLRLGDIRSVVMEDWKQLVDRSIIGGDPAYQRHEGKPVVAVWGVGFDDDRNYTLAECEELVEFLKSDPVYGGNTVMLGVPHKWLNFGSDTMDDPALHRIMAKADIVSPWSVGRYRSVEQIKREAGDYLGKDLAWCKEREIDYMPVIYSGFSWHNLYKTRNRKADLDAIPRSGGRFLWEHGRAVKASGTNMVYVAMFDEMDEGTQIFKVTDNPPVGESPFLTYKGDPSDHYLWLAGRIRALITGEIKDSAELPIREE